MADESIGNIKRQAVQGTQANVQQKSLNRSTVNTAVRVQAEDNSSNVDRVVRGISQFGGVIEAGAKAERERKLELDKVTQTSRAVAGLAPTDDATTEGLQAYQVVKVRDDMLDVNAQVSSAIEQNPEMSEDEYEELTRSLYQPVLQKYQGNQVMMDAVSNRMQESQVQLQTKRRAVQKQHLQFKNQDLFKESITTYRDAASDPTDLHQALTMDGIMSKEGYALGVDAETQRTMLVQQAVLDADEGDTRLLNALKMESWADNDPRIDKAEETAQKWNAQENAVAIGTQWGKIQDSWKNRRASWAQTTAAIEQLNSQFPGTVSASAVASLRQSQKDVVKKDQAVNKAMLSSFRAMTDPDAVPLGQDDLYSDKEKRDVASKVNDAIDDKYNKLVASGELDEASARTHRVKDKLIWSSKNRVIIPQIKSVMGAISASPLDPNGEGTERIDGAIDLMSQMSAGVMDMYATEKQQEFYNNYRLIASEDNTASAKYRAWSSVYKDSGLRPEEQKDLRDNVSSRVTEMGDGGFWEGIGRKLGVTDQKAIPDWHARQLTRSMEAEAKARVALGGNNVEAIAEQVPARFEATHTRLKNGTFMSGNSADVAKAMTYRDGDEVVQINPTTVPDAFDSFMENNLSELQRESAIDDLTPDDMEVRVGQSGRTFTIADSFGTVLTAPIPMEDVGREYTEERVKQAEASRKERENRPTLPTTGYRPY